MVELLLGEIAAAHPGAYSAAARIQGEKAALQHGPFLPRFASSICQLLQLRHLPRHRLVGGLLHLGVKGGVHPQSIRLNVVVFAVSPFDQPFSQVLGHMGRRPQRLDLPLKIQLERPLGQHLDPSLVERAVFGHLGQYQVAALHCTLRVLHRVVIARTLEHADQGGALQDIELVGRLVKIGARCHLDTEGVVEKRHGVEVSFENLALGIHRLDLQRRDGFLELARDGGGAADFFRIKIACQLLCDG